MDIVQFTGPFQGGQIIQLLAQIDRVYTHIGIQVPHRQPIAYIKDRQASQEITINGISYKINQTGILEFEGLSLATVDIRIQTPLPHGAIIEVAYETKE